MADYGLAQAMFAADTSGKTRQQLVEGWTRQGFGKDSTQTWLKVTDTDSGGEMVAAAMWRFQLEEAASGDEITVLAEVKEEQRNETGPPTVLDAMAKTGKEFRREFIGTHPHGWLQILVTHPKHQRRGAGGMLVTWGCDLADERNLMCVLTASQAGVALYRKHGFEVVKEAPLDLRPYGVDKTEIRRFMIRPARAKTT
ncbi:hypothetical protein LTR85_006228 [Meristemomyces frigidus]|nr:hypothetical protein LTR85_006228 [Meristemomyces frigidus]